MGGRRRLWRQSLRRMMRPADPASRARARTRSKFAFRVGWTRLGQPEQFLIMRPTPTLSLSQAGPREEIRHPRDGQRCCGDPSFLQFKRCSFPSSSSSCCIIIVTHSIHPSIAISLLLFLCLRKMYTYTHICVRVTYERREDSQGVGEGWTRRSRTRCVGSKVNR